MGCLVFRGVSNVLKLMEKRSELSELFVILWVSAVEGCSQGSTVSTLTSTVGSDISEGYT